MVRRQLACALLALASTGTAHADRMIRPAGVVHEVTTHAEADSVALVKPRDEPPASLPKLGGVLPPHRSGIRKAIGVLFFTRDLEIPGAKNLGVRLIPTKKAIGGEALIPFVLRVRFSPSRYGLEMGGRF